MTDTLSVIVEYPEPRYFAIYLITVGILTWSILTQLGAGK